MDKQKAQRFAQYLVSKYGQDGAKKKIQKIQKTGKVDQEDLKGFAESEQKGGNQKKDQKKTSKDLHGAKLNYIKTLKHQCADDEELVYYKVGGKVDCGCKKKGGDIEPKKECGGGAVSKFKKARKALNGTQFKKPQFKDEAARDSFYINVHGAEDLEATRPGSYKKNKDGKIQWTPDRTKAPYNKKKKENKQPVYQNQNTSNKKGGTIEKFKSARCGSKMKKK